MDVSGPEAAVPSVEPSAKLFCCSSVRRRLSLSCREELYHILRMTGPLLVGRILNYLLFFVVTIFCGRLGNTVLAGYAMASATINVTTAATGLGMAIASDTLVSQTFGGKNLLRVGVILQRGILILSLFCLPCCALLINTQPLLLLLGQDPEVARIAQLYVVAYLPAVPAMFMYQLQLSYLQNQGVVLPQVYAAVVVNIVNVLANYILLFWLDLGEVGSAIANSFGQVFNCLALFLYIYWKKIHVKTWGGWSSEALQEWGSYMKLAVPTTLMTCFEWWIYEIGGFLAGMLSEIDLAAQHVVIMLAYVNYMIPLGIQGAACIRVGNALGAGDTKAAILTSKVALALGAVLAIVQGILLGSTKRVIGYVFTSDEKITELVAHLLNIYCPLQFCNGIVCVAMGVLMGTALQKVAAVANLLGYYCIGLPVIIALTFSTQLQVAGFWLGLLAAVFVLAIFFVVLILKLNWKKMTAEAVERAHAGQKASTMTTPYSHLSPESPCPMPRSSGNRESWNGYVAVGSEEEEEERRYRSTTQEGSRGPEPSATSKALLSSSQLILRRGLTAIAALLILTVGIVIHLTVPLPDVTHPFAANSTLDWGDVNSTLSSPLPLGADGGITTI